MFRRSLTTLALCALAAGASAQTVDELIAKNIQARGGLDKVKGAQSVRMTGRMNMGPIEAPFTMEWKRPASMRIEFTFQGMTGTQAYDAGTGWAVMPFNGNPNAEPMSADDLKEFEEQADLDGPLVDYKAKGHTVELVGKEKVEGTDTFKLKVTLKNGDVRYIFLEGDTFLGIRTEGKSKIRGSEVEVESSLGEFKEVGGLVVAHSIDSGVKGNPQQRQKLTIDKVELNVPLEGARFKMPEKKPEPAEKK